MEEDDNKKNQRQHNFPFHHDFHEHHIVDDSAKGNLAKVLRNLGTTLRQQQETMLPSSTSSLLRSVREESFTSHSSSSSSFTTATTGGNETLTDGENKNEPSLMETSACPTGIVTLLSSSKQQQGSIVSSLDMMKRTKTLSFLHNEDLLTSNMRPLLAIDDNPLQLPQSPSAPLFRSMSFQERRQYQHQASLKRVESGKELKTSSGESNFRKVTILSPKHSLQELNERIKNMQQQMLYGSSELSL